MMYNICKDNGVTITFTELEFDTIDYCFQIGYELMKILTSEDIPFNALNISKDLSELQSKILTQKKESEQLTDNNNHNGIIVYGDHIL